MKLFEMEGLLRGKCLPGDMKVNETNAEYLVRKFAELEARCAALAAEAHGFKRFFMFSINAAFDGCDLTGDQIQEVAKEFGLVRVEPYCAAKHEEMSGDPGVMEEGDDFYIANKTPATDAFLAEVRAQGRNEGINFAASRLAAAFNHGFVDKPMAEVGDVVRMILDAKGDLANSPTPPDDGLSGEYAEKSLEDWSAQLRQEAK